MREGSPGRDEARTFQAGGEESQAKNHGRELGGLAMIERVVA